MHRQVTDLVAKYFFLSCLDEQIAFSASLKVLGELQSHNWLDKDHRSRWVQVMRKWNPKVRSVKPRQWDNGSGEKGFPIPDDFDMSAWVSFLSTGDASEVEAVLLSRVLRFEDEEIADGLGVTVGTVRYRTGRGLRQLGGFIEP